MTSQILPVTLDDPINRAILAVSEDQLVGFREDPIGDIARLSGLEVPTVVERIRAMLEAGIIRRVRQTLITNNLAPGALVAWSIPEERLQQAFEWMFNDDPFSGHVVIRTADPATPGAAYRLWTTIKVPQGFSLEAHCDLLARWVGARAYRTMSAKALFVLGVGHTRRRGMEPGTLSASPAVATFPAVVELSDLEWQVLGSLKREFSPGEIRPDIWSARASEAGVALADFVAVGRRLAARGVVGRFSTFLEHVKPVAGGQRVTRYNALFHWAVPPGRELEAGGEVGRHDIMTHAYWREGGPEFYGVNIMGVVHGMEKDVVLAHKAAIDAHLDEVGIPVAYTNVFWGGRSEIKPSEIAPASYVAWCEQNHVDPAAMREDRRYV